jgi:hypothetical protein
MAATLTVSVLKRALARLHVTDWQDGMSLSRTVAGETEQCFPAWEPQPGSDRWGIDPATPINRPVTWTLLDASGGTVASAQATIPSQTEWLTSVPDGRISECWVESWPSREYPVEQNVMRPLGSRWPVVESGLRQVAQSKITLLTVTATQRTAMRQTVWGTTAILRSLDPIGHGVFWMALGQVTEHRVSPLVQVTARRWEAEAAVVAPWPVEWTLTGGNTWQDWMQETWADWRAVDPATGRPRTWRGVLSGDAEVRRP